MPLAKDRRTLGKCDTLIYIDSVVVAATATGGPGKSFQINGPYWAFVEHLTRKQGEVEIESRITSLQQVRFTIRYTTAVNTILSKAGRIRIGSDARKYDIISVSKDKGRNQYIEVVTELKE